MSEMAPGTTGYFQQYLKELQDKFKLKKFIAFNQLYLLTYR